MSSRRLTVLAALLAVASSLPGQQAKKSAKAATTADGVFVGRTGKPMAGARLILAEVLEDAEVTYARIRLADVSTSVADGQGRFQLKGFTPGTYTLVYLPAGVTAVMTHEFSIKSLLAVTKSITPLLRNVELGKNEPYAARSWGQFTLLKGHTFYSEGPYMKVWNATLRRGEQGPYLEVRRGVIWLQKLDDKSQIKLDAWSY